MTDTASQTGRPAAGQGTACARLARLLTPGRLQWLGVASAVRARPGHPSFSGRRAMGGFLLAGGLLFAGGLFLAGSALLIVSLALFASLLGGLIAGGSLVSAGFFLLLMASALTLATTACSTRLPQVEGDPGGLFTASTAQPLPEEEEPEAPIDVAAAEEGAQGRPGAKAQRAPGAQDPPEPPGLLGSRRLPPVEREPAFTPPSGALSDPGFGSRRFTVKVGLLSDSLRRLVEDRFAWTLKWVSETDRRIEGEFDISASSLEAALRELLGLYQGAFVADLYDANRMVLVQEAPLGSRIHDAAGTADSKADEE